jgi:hypothetical protein
MENEKELKQYNNLNDLEKNTIREHKSWKQSECPINYKLHMLNYWRKRARLDKIEHLL